MQVESEKIFDTVILVLLYDKEIRESATLNSVGKLHSLNKRTLLVVWNNGPVEILINETFFDSLMSKGFEIVVEQTTNNISLAKIYNSIIDKYISSSYVFLDHDTILNNKYFKTITSIQNNVLLPLVCMNNEIIYPKINGHTIKEGQKINDADFVMSIGSGLVLSRDITNLIKDKFNNVFDERFYLYGVDSTFFYRLRSLKFNSKITIIDPIEHSLSKYENEPDKIRHFRIIERSYDAGLKYRYYYGVAGLYYFCRNILAFFVRYILGKKQTFLLGSFIKAYISGKHYRHKN